MEYVYRFPVVKGVQAKTDYYIAMVPLKMLKVLFPNDEEELVQPEFRAQRKLNETRIPIISKYILENRDSYVFSALATSIDGEFSFEESSEHPNLGVLNVSMDAHFLINDGQHRKASILEALKEDRSLENETISIVFYADQGLTRSQQIFTDLNKNAVKTSNSISELYDSRDQLAVITRNVIRRIEFLNTYTDKEKDILGKYSSSLFTLNTFYSANKNIVGSKPQRNCEEFLYVYWKTVCKHMALWCDLTNREITKVDLRENYIATQSVVIQALGRVGRYFYDNKINPGTQLQNLEKVNWHRGTAQWSLRAIGKNGRILTNKTAVLLIANVIKKELNIPLSEEEIKAETKLQVSLEG